MICGIYGSKFLKNIAVKYDGESYQLRLHVHDNMWCPMVMSIQTNNEDTFLEYIKKEIGPAIERLQTEYDAKYATVTDECEDTEMSLALRKTFKEKVYDAVIKPFTSLFKWKKKVRN